MFILEPGYNCVQATSWSDGIKGGSRWHRLLYYEFRWGLHEGVCGESSHHRY